MLPETPPAAPELERRTPRETDLRVFTDELIPPGGHRVDRSRPRPRPRVGWDRLTDRPVLRLAVLALAAVVAAGCSSSGSTTPGEGGQSARLSAPAGQSLTGVCPATVVVQASWFSQVEHFAAYQLLGAGGVPHRRTNVKDRTSAIVTIDGNAIVGTHNVLFITLDSLRYDVARDALNCGTTPHIAAVLPRGEWEERNSHAIFTFPAHQAFFAGFLPVPLSPRRHDRLFACKTIRGTTIGARTLVFDAPNIVSGFEQIGYRTVCIGGVGFFSRQTALGNVLSALFAESHWSPALGVDSLDSTEEQVRLALGVLDRCPGPAPMFLFVNVSATHVPHHGYLDDGIEDCVASQAAALSYADHHLGHLFDCLPRYGPWLVVMCADHGDAFGEEGLHGHARPHSVVWSVPYAEFLLPTV